MNKLKRAIISSAVDDLQVTEKGIATKRYCFEPDFIGFAGHFPGFPVLPAFVQIRMALTLAEELKGCSLELATVEKAKFLIQLRPQQEIGVACQGRMIGEKPGCEARLTVAEGLAASFLMTFKVRSDGI